MTVDSLLWLDVVGAGLLAVWVLFRFPDLGPSSLAGSLICFLAAQVFPNLGLLLVPLVLRLPLGPILVLALLAPSVLFVLLVASAWLIRACLRLGGPRGGHPVRGRLANTRV